MLTTAIQIRYNTLDTTCNEP